MKRVLPEAVPVPDPAKRRRRCACGCGGWTLRTWMRGHDQKAVHEMWEGLGFPGVAGMFAAYRAGRLVVIPEREGTK